MKILITGASGFISRCLIKYLNGHEILAVSRNDLNLSSLTAVSSYLQAHNFDWVIHCAVAGRHDIRSVDPSIVATNLSMFCNLYSNLDKVTMGMINFGSGAEFGIERNIETALEEDIWKYSPIHSYGYSKNLISRMSTNNPKCHNIRIFGCFDPLEDNSRLLKKLSLKQSVTVDKDRWFDTISISDLITIVDHVLSGTCGQRDINAVYHQKNKLSDILRLYCDIHNLDPGLIKVIDNDGLSYTGDSNKLYQLNLPLLGLEKSLELYST